MAEFSIGEVEKETGLKAHILRYWEEVVPFIRPRKDGQGRRFYSKRDIELILRVKYLVYEEKYTLEGAGERLVTELTDGAGAPTTREQLRMLRGELMDLYATVQRWKNKG